MKKILIILLAIVLTIGCLKTKDDKAKKGAIFVGTPVLTITTASNIRYTTVTLSSEVVFEEKFRYKISSRGFVIGTETNPTIESNLVKIESPTSDFGKYEYNVTDLNVNTKYYVRSYSISNNNIGYGEPCEFTTLNAVLPTVTTGEVTDISYTMASITGNVTAENDKPVTERGFVWSTNSNPTYSNNVGKSSNGSGLGNYSAEITNLTNNTKYYIRAYAKSEVGVGYGEQREFTTVEFLNQTFTVGGVSFKMMAIEGGTFQMGDTFGDGNSDEKPVHSVTLSDYWIGETEITQALWQAVMGSNPSSMKGDNLPVEQVSWNDCQSFITKLNEKTGKKFRLPTEAEWEYAARGGNKSKGYKYSGSNTIGDVAWYTSNSGSKTHNVKTKQANELGIYDMSGNVWEWCSDWYGSYGSNAQTNPTGPASGSYRVLRGGSWNFNESDCRVPYRNDGSPGNGINFVGVRVALVQ